MPAVNVLFLAGVVDLKVVQKLKYRTKFVDEDVLPVLDATLAERVVVWGGLSDLQVEKKIDQLIEQHDPDAVRRRRGAVRQRDITIGDWEDDIGTTSIWGRLFVTDGAVVKKRLTVMASGVCADDPRTVGQRRADALGALAAGSDQLSCRCASPDCPARS
ncbi:13E12 repeat family protein [Mycolicibacterium komossense]|uniref:13E12 repeat family protein n=1 Tax=Mycolicibacterium komossense TaxID=1779 RepID=UPI0021F2782C|nr:13E12 repeat family protein [Mycolicibacterium komossense]